jgi:peroxiredoxin
MKRLMISLLCGISATIVCSQNNFTINGTITTLSKATTIILSSGAGRFSVPVDAAGKFEIHGRVTEAEFALIQTDSSGADGIWLEPGDYTISCKEIRKDGIKGYLFRMPAFKGPLDAMINYGFSQPRYYIKGISPEETRLKQKAFAINYIDSIFQYYPDSKVLPGMINLSQNFIGDEATLAYQALLSGDQKNDSNSKQLENYFKRKEKIEREKLFNDFTMKDNKGNNFKLSSVTNKKLLLIDFWSSDCAPCRAKHKRLVELYKKYSDRGLEIISVSLDTNNAAWQNAIKNDGMVWINVSDIKGWDNSLAKSYYVRSIPFALWLDGTTKILGAALSEKEIESYLQ